MSTLNEITRILVVDDDATDRMAVTRELARHVPKTIVVECDGADAALAALREGAFACVLLDYFLPGMTASEFLPVLKAHAPHTPVIVLTGHGDEQIAVELMKSGASDYQSKDRIDGKTLARSIRQAVALQSARANAERVRHLFLEKLRDLVEISPRLYALRGVRPRLEVAVAETRRLLGAKEAFIFLSIGPAATYLLAREDGVSPIELNAGPWKALAAERSDQRNEPRVRLDLAEGQPLLSVLMSSDAGNWRGLLGVRLEMLPADSVELFSFLLAQLGDLVTVAVENARLDEATERAVAARDAIMAVVSHDLRSPLNSMTLGVDVLRDRDDPARKKVILDRMDRATRQMTRLLDDLIDVARIESRSLSIEAKPQTARALIDDAVSLASPLADAAGVRLRVGSVPDVELRVDRQRIVQVLMNLIGNALKFTPAGGEVELAIEHVGGQVRFSVSDTGAGIAPEQLPRVFERYYRKEGKGLGLGLFIAQAIVVAHGGTIGVSSEMGRGACFTFALPVIDAAT